MSLLVLGCVLIGFVILLFTARKAKSPVGKPWSVCGIQSSYGYSDRAEEDAYKTKPMCLAHLVSELESNYQKFRGRAVVIAGFVEGLIRTMSQGSWVLRSFAGLLLGRLGSSVTNRLPYSPVLMKASRRPSGDNAGWTQFTPSHELMFCGSVSPRLRYTSVHSIRRESPRLLSVLV